MSTSQHSVPYIPSDLRRCASYALRSRASNGQDKEKRDPGMQTLDLVECGTLPFGEKEMANARRPTIGCFDPAQDAVAFVAHATARPPDGLLRTAQGGRARLSVAPPWAAIGRPCLALG